MEKYGSIYLIQMTSEKPFYFAFKTRIENRKGDVNAWWHGLFQSADRDFPKSVPTGSIVLFLILCQHKTWAKQKTKNKKCKDYCKANNNVDVFFK